MMVGNTEQGPGHGDRYITALSCSGYNCILRCYLYLGAYLFYFLLLLCETLYLLRCEIDKLFPTLTSIKGREHTKFALSPSLGGRDLHTFSKALGPPRPRLPRSSRWSECSTQERQSASFQIYVYSRRFSTQTVSTILTWTKIMTSPAFHSEGNKAKDIRLIARAGQPPTKIQISPSLSSRILLRSKHVKSSQFTKL